MLRIECEKIRVLKSLKTARRFRNIRPSGIRRLFSLANGVPDIVRLGIGEPDFVPPPHILEAAKRSLDEGKTHYAPNTGIAELREALAEKAKRDYGLSYNPDSEVLVTAGGVEAIFLALIALMNRGDEALVSDPSFVCYRPSILMAGGVPVSIPVLEKDNFKLDAEVVMSLITEKSRVIITNTPNNPTGSVLTHDDIAKLGKLAVERDLIVISDEVYEKIIYDNAEHHCLATFPGMQERTIVINSFSKTYSMTGFRVGCAMGPENLISAMTLAHQFITACVNSPAQHAAVAALRGSQKFVKDMVNEFDRRRRLLHSRLNEIGGFGCSLPQGAFYAFANIKEFGISSEEFSERLLNEGKIVTVPGSAFGRYGEGYIRISYATAYEKVEEALDRIEKIAGNFM
ncbi:MAG: pyridoxal phosphate-dependent aminotransferase [Candidatus Bathyarchaeota archaeon]|nr:MAG: pyridoxal phosphate-dependent aminotransferase [Candidatus Bathyarchaeota archaeon]